MSRSLPKVEAKSSADGDEADAQRRRSSGDRGLWGLGKLFVDSAGTYFAGYLSGMSTVAERDQSEKPFSIIMMIIISLLISAKSITAIALSTPLEVPSFENICEVRLYT